MINAVDPAIQKSAFKYILETAKKLVSLFLSLIVNQFANVLDLLKHIQKQEKEQL